MAQKAPGKHFRKGLSLTALTRMFPDDETAEKWFAEVRWPNGPACPYCGSVNVQSGIKHRTMTHRCRDCPDRRMFSLRTGTAMQSSKLGYQIWAIATYLLTTNLKGVSSMKLHRDVDITQKSAWFLAHRLRKSFDGKAGGPMAGPVEADETYIGGKARNMHASKRRELRGRGGVDKTAVAGIKDRATGRVAAKVVARTDGATLRGFVEDHAADGAKVYTDEASAYNGLENHEAVRHSVGEYVRGMAHTAGVESFWSMLKRGYNGTYHHLSPEHLQRYVREFEGRHNIRNQDTLDQMAAIVRGLDGKRLRYDDLTRHSHGGQAQMAV